MLEMEMTPMMDRRDPNDPVAVYVREVCTAEPLTKTEEAKLFRELGHSDEWDERRENARED